MKNIADRLTLEEHNHKRYVLVDYRGLREKEMIELIQLHLELTLRDKIPFLADYHNTYISSGYILHGKKFIELTRDVIDRGAFIGVDPIKQWIFKGVVMASGVNYKAFNSKEQAIDFLTGLDH